MSEFSRETLLNIIETDHVQCGEASALARMALAAMDSEPVEMPLDYLQGHKDGLEWAAQLAESNHPQTGDWLYDDPIELAKAIRKGPDMPPSQPALDTKPVAYTDERNLGYIDRGRETAYLWGKQNSEASDVALYRHAQPVPVVPNEIKHRIGGLDWGWEGEFNRGWNACRAAMLQELKKSAGTEAICRSDENVQVLHTKSQAQSDCCPAQNVVVPAQSPIDHGYLPECECSGCKATARICAELAGNSQVIPDGYVMVPMRLTAENGAKGALSGEFSETKFVNCPECFGDDECETCDGSGRIEITVPVTWTTIKEIWAKGVEHFAAAPQSPGSEPATVPGKWIPVSERMPDREVDVQVYCPDKKEQMVAYLERNELEGYFRFATWRTGDGIYCQPTHWMQLPAGPREVKGE
ncbi:TPA: DUF551 domain-containing protein [Klebsiella pneumoniae]|nr:DUF551 domain-containing protein [Klebsiella pneumoniae]MDU5433366.1 DUF551 domain-containing protein [Klebsiella pneumoniae]MDU7235090.1 DUF551 domain-containing protein [Klebsiella pneumoniae]UOP93310.1 DUF551 domain-containing protein [Klebsiella pneumoniae]